MAYLKSIFNIDKKRSVSEIRRDSISDDWFRKETNKEDSPEDLTIEKPTTRQNYYEEKINDFINDKNEDQNSKTLNDFETKRQVSIWRNLFWIS